MTWAKLPPLMCPFRCRTGRLRYPLRLVGECRRFIDCRKMALNLFPQPEPLAADLSRLREQALPHPVLDRALARADMLGERRKVLKRRRVGERHGSYLDSCLSVIACRPGCRRPARELVC